MASVQADWVLEELEKLAKVQPEMVNSALEKLLQEHPDLRWAIVVGAYLDGHINLGKAAELLGMHRLALLKEFLHKGIPIRLGPETVEEAKAEVEAWSKISSSGGVEV